MRTEIRFDEGKRFDLFLKNRGDFIAFSAVFERGDISATFKGVYVMQDDARTQIPAILQVLADEDLTENNILTAGWDDFDIIPDAGYLIYCPVCAMEFFLPTDRLHPSVAHPNDWTWDGNIKAVREYFGHDCR